MSWRDLKNLIRKRFVPPSYARDLHNKLQRLYQGSKSVEEYHKEMKMNLIRAQIRESEEAILARFLHGTLGELVHQAIKRSASRKSFVGASGWKGKDTEKERVRREKILKKGSDISHGWREAITIPSPIPYRTSSIKCFKCLGSFLVSQYKDDIVKEDGEVESESSLGEATTSSEVETLSDDSYYEGDLLVVRQLMNSHMGEEVETQREKFSILGSYVNVACERLVKKIALPTIVHLGPYILQWLSKKGELLVDKQAEVTFTLGSYEDKVVCDVVPMQATYLPLGKLWQFDKKVIHIEVTNQFTFIHMGQRVVLKPLSPKEVHEDQKKMKVKKESERKTEGNKKKKIESDSKK
ncbi:hypothetical protein CR513_29396, partial [Mucuna pruriens]